MATIPSPKSRAPRPRSRQSIAHMPPIELMGEKENVTFDSSGLVSASRLKPTTKKPRSKSIGPGGLDALQEGSGNRGTVRISYIEPISHLIRISEPFGPLR